VVTKSYLKYIFLIQARTNSTRFPKKVLEPVFNAKTLIEIIYNRVLLSKHAQKDNVYILTTSNKDDDIFEKLLQEKDFRYFRGEEENVYQRFYDFLSYKILDYPSIKYLVRICADNPLLEPSFIDDMINYIETGDDEPDYVSYKDRNGSPAILTHFGFFSELIKVKTFIEAKKNVRTNYDKEHVTTIFYTSDKINKHLIEMPPSLNDLPLRLTFDTKEDLIIVKEIFNKLGDKADYLEIMEFIRNRENLQLQMKNNILRNKK